MFGKYVPHNDNGDKRERRNGGKRQSVYVLVLLGRRRGKYERGVTYVGRKKTPERPGLGRVCRKRRCNLRADKYNIGRLLRNATERRKGFVDIQLFAEKHSGENVRNLPPIVLKRFYKRLGDIRHGEHYETTPTGKKVVVIDDDLGRLWRVTCIGTFGEPQIVSANTTPYHKAGRDGSKMKTTKGKYDKKKKD